MAHTEKVRIPWKARTENASNNRKSLSLSVYLCIVMFMLCLCSSAHSMFVLSLSLSDIDYANVKYARAIIPYIRSDVFRLKISVVIRTHIVWALFAALINLCIQISDAGIIVGYQCERHHH